MFTIFITAHRKLALWCICYGRHIRLSVRLSVTLRYYVKTRGRRRMQSLPPGSPVPPVFWRQEWLMRDHPVQINVECKEVDPCENSRTVHISRHNSGTVMDSGNSSVNANRMPNMGFPTSHQPRSCVTPDFPKMVFRCPNLSFFRRNFDKKHTSMLQSFTLSKNSQRWGCSAINYLSNGINILAGDDPGPVKFGPTGRHRPPIGRTRVFQNEWLISAMFTDSWGRVLTNYWFNSVYCQFTDCDYTQ